MPWQVQYRRRTLRGIVIVVAMAVVAFVSFLVAWRGL